MDAPAPIAIDLFSGAGGVTQGLRDAGYEVRAAVEFDPASVSSYRMNHPEVEVLATDIRTVNLADLMARANVIPGQTALLAACAPCQGFSSLNTKRNRDDERDNLILEVVRFVEALRPKAVAFENVPRLRRDHRFAEFVDLLRSLGYGVRDQIIDAADVGVPQHRRRLVALAVDGTADADVPTLTSALAPQQWVRDAFRGLPDLGEDVLHVDRPYPPIVLERIKAISGPGASRSSLPPHLRLACHDRLGDTHATSSYGRMWWDQPSPTITSKCTVPSSGRFIHPDQDRVITLREAARLQSFKVNADDDLYRFDLAYGRVAVARQIGNAVPVKLAKAVGQCLLPSPAQRVVSAAVLAVA